MAITTASGGLGWLPGWAVALIIAAALAVAGWYGVDARRSRKQAPPDPCPYHPPGGICVECDPETEWK
jgi:hypothetical protein